MAKSFKTLRDEMTPERRNRNQLRTELALLEMSLNEIRQHRQQADRNGANGGTAKPVNPPVHPPTALPHDMLLSTLVDFIADMGGTLKLVAQFPDEEIVINQFQAESLLLHGQP